jgi:hypothetical protein
MLLAKRILLNPLNQYNNVIFESIDRLQSTKLFQHLFGLLQLLKNGYLTNLEQKFNDDC